MVGSTETSIFQVRTSSNIVRCSFDISRRACPSALVV